MKEVTLRNRLYKDVKLVEVSENVYRLDRGSAMYISESYDGKYDREHPESRTIFSVDPECGPYYQVGDEVPGIGVIEKFTVEQVSDSADDDIYYFHIKSL